MDKSERPTTLNEWKMRLSWWNWNSLVPDFWIIIIFIICKLFHLKFTLILFLQQLSPQFAFFYFTNVYLLCVPINCTMICFKVELFIIECVIFLASMLDIIRRDYTPTSSFFHHFAFTVVREKKICKVAMRIWSYIE